METIISYIDNLFRAYPDTSQSRRAKEELLSIMEDKYHELKREGKSENEAIGIVISEFGSMDEIAPMLEAEPDPEQNSKASSGIDFTKNVAAKKVSFEQATEYIRLQQNLGIKIGIGVMLCILSPTISVMMEALSDGGFLSQNIAEMLGTIGLICMVAAGVGIFIISGISHSKYEDYEAAQILMDDFSKSRLEKEAEDYRPVFGSKIAAGVVLCILSVIPSALLDGIFGGSSLEWISELSSLALFSFVSVGVFLFISAGIKQTAYDDLLGRKKAAAAPEKKKKEKWIGITAAIYWPVVTAAYLTISLITMDWGRTWFVWPVAGILFGGVSGAISLIMEK